MQVIYIHWRVPSLTSHGRARCSRVCVTSNNIRFSFCHAPFQDVCNCARQNTERNPLEVETGMMKQSMLTQGMACLCVWQCACVHFFEVCNEWHHKNIFNGLVKFSR